MSLDVALFLTEDQLDDQAIRFFEDDLNEYGELKVFAYNITHNLKHMAIAADLYDVLWHGEVDAEYVDTAGELIEAIRAGVSKLEGDREYYESFNSYNGWGVYDDLLTFAANYLAACKKFPEARIWLSR